MAPTLLTLPEATCFQLLDAESRSVLQQRASRISFRASRPVLRAGENAPHVLCLLEGSVRLSLRMPAGLGPLLDLRAPPSLLGVHEVLLSEPTRFSVQTLEPSEFLAVPAELFNTWAREQARFAHALTLEVTHQLEDVRMRMGRLAYGQVAERLGRLLLEYAEICGSPSADGLRLRARLSQQSLAENLGVDRKSILRAMEVFRAKGLLSKADGRYSLPSVSELRAFVEAESAAHAPAPVAEEAEDAEADESAA